MKKLEKWMGKRFASSSGLTPEFAAFSRDIKAALQAIVGYDLVSYNRGHFYFSAFLRQQATGRHVYLLSSDVRSPDKWYNHLIIRTAQSEKDYSGGPNRFCRITNVQSAADDLLKNSA